MRVLGITAEYNPFHNGHAYHIETAKKVTGADAAVVAMSGDFTQRGEPAIFDKWTRSRDAIRNGADLVIELPFIFACNRAPYFAFGGVDSLVRLGSTHIAFGCEADDPEILPEISKNLQTKEEELSDRTKAEMSAGLSYAKAYELAVRSLLGDEAADTILRPNNILAVEYLKRINFWNDRGMDIKAVPIKREGSGYDEVRLEKGYAGASAIRRLAEEKKWDEITRLVPEGTRLMEALEEGSLNPGDEIIDARGRYFQLIKGILVRSTADEIGQIYCIGEGIENRLKSGITKATDLEPFISSVVSRRYTAAVVRRMLVYIALGLKREDADRLLEKACAEPLHGYLRLLAAGEGGRRILRSSSGIITNINKQEPEEEAFRQMLDIDIKAADLYNTIFGRRLYDYSDRVIRPYIDS